MNKCCCINVHMLVSSLKLLNCIPGKGKLPYARASSTMAGVVENLIRNKLKTSLITSHLEVINESYMHNVPKGAETHFKVVVVSDKFDGLPLIKRHRLVNDILKEELSSGVHALSIVAKTTKQWQESDQIVESSPTCRGGFVPLDVKLA